MKKIYIIGFLIAAFIPTAHATPQAKVCTPAEAVKAEADVKAASTWWDLYLHSTRFAHCDQGVVSTAFSDQISKRLADDWQSLYDLKTIIMRDFAFRDYVMRHLDTSVPEDRLARIAGNATANCQVDTGILCSDMMAAIAGLNDQARQPEDPKK